MSMIGRNRFVVADRARQARFVLLGAVGAMVVAACGSSSNGGNGGTPDAGGDVSMAMTCTPGQSIACVGSGGCSGGQACTSDGSGYGACECAAGSDGGDASTGTGSDGATGEAGKPDAGPEAGAPDAGSCSTYATSTIAAMRTAGVSGCFKLSDVVSIGLAPSATAPRLFVQDLSGGDYSAMMTTCATAGSTHPCAVASSVSAITDGRSVSVTGSYVMSTATHFEQFFVDGITDNGAATPPAPAGATLAQIERASMSYNLAFQHVTLTVSNANTLQMYDFTPSELVYAGAAACPYQAGFGMIPKSVVGVTAGAACSSGSAQPAGQSAPNGAEVLIGTDFYTGYTVSSDCRCAKMFSDLEPVAISTLGGTLGGMLVSSLASGASAGFFYLAPKTASDAPVTNTVAGM
jgi:hypothetical protein